jgi:carbon monoxide dehydrogenase subunit G
MRARSPRAARLLASFVAAGVALVAVAAPANGPVRLGDVPGTNGQWQQGSSVIAAPLDEVHGWLTDFAAWPKVFPDVQSATVLQHDGNAYTVRFRSKIVGRDMTLRLEVGPRVVVYTGSGKDVTSQGKITLEPLDRGHTRVLMQSSAEVHGLAGAFASQGMKRKRAFKKMESDLTTLHILAARASTRM